LRWLVVLFAVTACDRVFELDTVGPDAPAIAIDARTGYAASVLADGPVAYWRLGDASINSAVDETNNGNVGMLLGGVQPGAPGPLVGDADTATEFDGIDDTITMGDRLAFEGKAPFTIEAWVRPTAHANYAGVLSKTDESAGGANKVGYLLYDQYLTFGFERIGAADSQTVTTGALALGMWVAVAVTYDGTTLTLYIDSVPQMSSTTDITIPATTKPFAIGGRNGGVWLFFGGSIDEVAIYDHPLDQTRIEAHRRVALGQ
jgi:hypothetical protein